MWRSVFEAFKFLNGCAEIYRKRNSPSRGIPFFFFLRESGLLLYLNESKFRFFFLENVPVICRLLFPSECWQVSEDVRS
jgi:hypothetical protein